MSINDYFKEVFANDVSSNSDSLKLFDFTKLQLENHDCKLFFSTFKSLHEARRYFYIWFLESIFSDLELYYQSISQISSVEFQMLYVYFINFYL